MDKKSEYMINDEGDTTRKDTKANYAEIKKRAAQSKVPHLGAAKTEKIQLNRQQEHVRRQQAMAAQQRQPITVNKAGLTDQLALALGTMYGIGKYRLYHAG